MEKKRRSEKLVTLLRWPVLAAALLVTDELATPFVLALGALVAIYNGWQTFVCLDSERFAKHGRTISLASKVLDVFVASVLVAAPGQPMHSFGFLVYCFVLVTAGLTASTLKKVFIASAGIIVANSIASVYSVMSMASDEKLVSVLVLRNAILVFGAFVAAFIAKTRTQEELSVERGSYIHGILKCGAQLTSMRNVHELATFLVESAVTHTNAGGGQILLKDEAGELETEAFYANSRASEETNAQFESTLYSYASWVMSCGREFIVRSGGGTDMDADFEKDRRPAIAVPILWKSSRKEDDQVLGVLMVWGFEDEDFGEDAVDILGIFAALAGAAIINLKLYTNMQKSFVSTLQSLANSLEARDEYTLGHSERVMQVSSYIAEELGVPQESIETLKNAALLHDIGKIGVPDAILRKAGKLTQEEWETMRRHPIVSEDICRPLGMTTDVLFLRRHHHERLDGKGYPDGLSPEDCPLLQRIIVVSDSFDAMRSRRPYRDVMPLEELIAELNRCAGRTMDPSVVNALLKLMERGDLDHVYEKHDLMISGTTMSMSTTRRQTVVQDITEKLAEHARHDKEESKEEEENEERVGPPPVTDETDGEEDEEEKAA